MKVARRTFAARAVACGLVAFFHAGGPCFAASAEPQPSAADGESSSFEILLDDQLLPPYLLRVYVWASRLLASENKQATFAFEFKTVAVASTPILSRFPSAAPESREDGRAVYRFGRLAFGVSEKSGRIENLEISAPPPSAVFQELESRASTLDDTAFPTGLGIQVSPSTQEYAEIAQKSSALAESDILLHRAQRSWDAGDYAKSIEAAQQALDKKSGALGKDHADVAKIQQMIASAKSRTVPGGIPKSAAPTPNVSASDPTPAPAVSAAAPRSGGAPAIRVNLPGDVALEMVRIPAGRFQMGSPETERSRLGDEGPVHAVTIGSDFYLGKYEVTQRQWLAVMGANPVARLSPPPSDLGDDYPVYDVSWEDCQVFVQALNRLGQGTFRLPGEAEWEYACRAGAQTRFFFGDSLSPDDHLADGLAGALPGNRSEYLWYGFNSGGDANGPRGCKPVGRKSPNPLGLYDMSGNVAEWCQDNYQAGYDGAPADGSARMTPSSERSFRGGHWDDPAGDCRSASRHKGGCNSIYRGVGLRLARGE